VELLLLLLMLVAGIALVGWLLAQDRPKGKRSPARRRASPRPDYDVYEDDTGSPLGLVDDPDDEWIEWAVMDDMLDDGDGDGDW